MEPNYVNSRIGEKIKDLRNKNGLTQQELADRVQITQSMLCQIERGSKIPTILLAWEIAKVLDFELNDYVSEKS